MTPVTEPDLRLRDRMEGWISFDDLDYNSALAAGRPTRSSCEARLTIEIDDLDAFFGAEPTPGRIQGMLRCPALGGDLDVERGEYRLFVPAPADDPPPAAEADQLRIIYRLYLRDADRRRLTLSGFKLADGAPGHNTWLDTSRMLVRLLSGHVEPDAEPHADDRVLATGVMRIRPWRFLLLIVGMRGGRGRRLRAPLRFQRQFMGTLRRINGPPHPRATQFDFPPRAPGSTRFAGQPPGRWHTLPEDPDLQRMIVPVEAGDVRITLHRLRVRDVAPMRRPVLLVGGLAMRANSFYGPPGTETLAGVLVRRGYDVWIENWRTSPDLPASDYTLDTAAVLDHPAAVQAIRDTGAERIAAVVHCMGSTSFSLSVVAGLVPGVDTVVSSAVSLDIALDPKSARRIRWQVPVITKLLPGLDPQWAVRPPSLRAAALARWARLVQRDYRDPLLAATTYFYGGAPEAMWSRRILDEATLDWIGREFGFAPFAIFAQVGKSARSQHLVLTGKYPELDDVDPARAVPPPGVRFTFLVGEENTFFLPAGQEATFARFEKAQPQTHRLVRLEGYSHLDVLVGRDAPRDVFGHILTALEAADDGA